jgi:hypothetical protein
MWQNTLAAYGPGDPQLTPGMRHRGDVCKMSEPASDSRRLDPAQARRMLGGLSLRPNERVLCLGPDNGALPGVAAILVGPTGRIVEADPAAVTAGAPLPYPDDEFDAVILDLTTPRPEQTHLLAEAARVTAPTGRVAIAMSHQDRSPVPAQQLAEKAGLRGVAVRSDPGTDSGTTPVEFVTAFPPVPGKPRDDTDITTEIHLPGQATEPTPSRRRHLVLAGSVAALVAAAAVGVVWSLAGAGTDTPVGGSDVLAGDTEPGIDQPAADDAPAGGALPTDDPDSGSSAASTSESDTSSSSGDSDSSGGSGSGSAGGGEPENQPPVIEDMGLSRPGPEGLMLLIEPNVSDPNGDDVSVSIEVDGEPLQIVDPARPKVAFRFSYDEVGAEHEAAVAVTATDAHGASTQQTETYRLVAYHALRLTNMRFTVTNPTDCFADEPVRRLIANIQIADNNFQRDEELRADRSDIQLSPGYTAIRPDPIEVHVSVDITFAGKTDSFDQVLSSDRLVFEAFDLTGDCRALLNYRVDVDRI